LVQDLLEGTVLMRKVIEIWLGLLVAVAVLLMAGSNSTLSADDAQITGGINGTCVTNCDNSPNLLGTGQDAGIFITGNGTAAKELLVLLVPNDTTNLFASDPLGSITIYDCHTGTCIATGLTGTSQFATKANAGTTFGLGWGSFGNSETSGTAFWGDETSNSGWVKVGPLLGIGLSNSINMSNVTTKSNSGTDTFGIYTFLITASMSKQDLLDIAIAGGLPKGTFVSEVTDTGTANPNSSAGVVDKGSQTTPEPGAMALMGTFLTLAGFALSRKLNA
jgi:hypothetical protein